jgi:hypothetical protein
LEYLPFSSSDMTRLSQMRDRHTAIPIVILDSMLPGQSLEIGSADPKFQKLIQHVFDSPEREIGMIGLNPHTGRPLNLGVRLLSILMYDAIQGESSNAHVISVPGYMFLDG